MGDLVSFPDQTQDPYLRSNADFEDDASDVEDFQIRPTDNLIAVGHVEGSSATLEVYGKMEKNKIG